VLTCCSTTRWRHAISHTASTPADCCPDGGTEGSVSPSHTPADCRKTHHVDVQPRVGGKAKPDPHLTQQPGDKAQVILAVLHHLLAARIRFCQREQKILTAQAVALAEDFSTICGTDWSW
jgi:hypothetical protein